MNNGIARQIDTLTNSLYLCTIKRKTDKMNRELGNIIENKRSQSIAAMISSDAVVVMLVYPNTNGSTHIVQ